MEFEWALHLPAKASLSWRITRLRLDEGGSTWFATGYKGRLVAVIPLPSLVDPRLEESWLAEIEARFEAYARDPLRDE